MAWSLLTRVLEESLIVVSKTFLFRFKISQFFYCPLDEVINNAASAITSDDEEDSDEEDSESAESSGDRLLVF